MKKTALILCYFVYKLMYHYRNHFGGFSKYEKIELPYSPATLLLDVYPEKSLPYHKDICILMFTIALVKKEPSSFPPTNNWIMKIW